MAQTKQGKKMRGHGVVVLGSALRMMKNHLAPTIQKSLISKDYPTMALLRD
jgi:hypothetical protein